VARPHDLLLLLGQVSCEASNAFREHPDAPVRDFDVGENVCDGELVLLALRRLVSVRREGGDVDQPGNAVIGSRGITSRKSQFLSKKGLNAVLEREWEMTTRVEIEVIIAQIQAINEGIARLDTQLVASGKQLSAHRNLVSIKGIGPCAAAILLIVIDEVSDF
jgi:hypothetical protein